MKKRIISLLLVALMVFSLMPSAAFAADAAQEDDIIVDASTSFGRLFSHLFHRGEDREDAEFNFIVRLINLILSIFDVSSGWHYDAEYHWHENFFGTQKDKAKHTFIEKIVEPTCTEKGTKTTLCSVCGYAPITEDIPAKGHTIVWMKEVPAEGYIEGMKAHWECSVCHKCFADKEGTTEIDRKELIIPAPLQNITEINSETIVSGTEDQPITYVLSEDTTLDLGNTNVHDVIIDLNGHDVTVNQPTVINGDNVQFVNGEETGGEIKYASSTTSSIVIKGDDFLMDNITMKHEAYDAIVFSLKSNDYSATIKNSTLTTNGTGAQGAVHVTDRGTVNVIDSTLNAPVGACIYPYYGVSSVVCPKFNLVNDTFNGHYFCYNSGHYNVDVSGDTTYRCDKFSTHKNITTILFGEGSYNIDPSAISYVSDDNYTDNSSHVKHGYVVTGSNPWIVTAQQGG